MGRTKQIAVNAFSMASPTQSWAGLWAHPKSNGLAYTDLEFWTDLARLCEREGLTFVGASPAATRLCATAETVAKAKSQRANFSECCLERTVGKVGVSI